VAVAVVTTELLEMVVLVVVVVVAEVELLEELLFLAKVMLVGVAEEVWELAVVVVELAVLV
jgi:hypothetical protein